MLAHASWHCGTGEGVTDKVVVTEKVGVTDVVTEVDAVTLGLRLVEAVRDRVMVTDGDSDRVTLTDCVTLEVSDEVGDTDGVRLVDGVTDGVLEMVGEKEIVADDDGVTLGDGAREDDNDLVGVRDGVSERVSVRLTETVLDWLRLPDSDLLSVLVVDGGRVADCAATRSCVVHCKSTAHRTARAAGSQWPEGASRRRMSCLCLRGAFVTVGLLRVPGTVAGR